VNFALSREPCYRPSSGRQAVGSEPNAAQQRAETASQNRFAALGALSDKIGEPGG
jgi:hypothetical protein